MNFTVWKYVIPIVPGDFTLKLPKDSHLLHVAVQDEHPQVWVLVNLGEQETEIRQFRVAGTGHRMGLDHLPIHAGSFMLCEGALVFHLFELFVPGART